MTQQITIVDAANKTQIDRPLNDEELAQRKADQAAAKEAAAIAEAKQAALESARAKLAKLGFTDDELEAFLGV